MNDVISAEKVLQDIINVFLCQLAGSPHSHLFVTAAGKILDGSPVLLILSMNFMINSIIPIDSYQDLTLVDPVFTRWDYWGRCWIDWIIAEVERPGISGTRITLPPAPSTISRPMILSGDQSPPLTRIWGTI